MKRTETRESQILRSVRKKSGLSQLQLATELDVQVRQYQRLEYGERPFSSVNIRVGLTLCRILQLDPYVAPESGTLLNDVVALEDSSVFFFDVKRVITTCSSACRFHTMVVQNLFFAISEKNRGLVQKLDYMSRRTTREKLISYLSEEAKKQNSPYITIPFIRQQLADYLSVDRSAMSNELCKMRDEGLLEFEKNRFKLL